MCGKLFFMASSSRTTDILVGQIHLADVVGIARENRGDEGDLEDEAGRSEVGVGGLEGGGSICARRWIPVRPPPHSVDEVVPTAASLRAPPASLLGCSRQPTAALCSLCSLATSNSSCPSLGSCSGPPSHSGLPLFLTGVQTPGHGRARGRRHERSRSHSAVAARSSPCRGLPLSHLLAGPPDARGGSPGAAAAAATCGTGEVEESEEG